MECEPSDMVILIYFVSSPPLINGLLNLGAPLIEALHGTLDLISYLGEGSLLMDRFSDNTGWCWYIPINDDTISIGFVMHEEFV
jgi:hypothetical protein